MADNISVTPGVGVTVATDEVGGVHHQCVKIEIGGNGTATPVSPTNPMPISLPAEAMDMLTAAATPLTTGGNVKVEMVDSDGNTIPVSETNWDDGLQPSESYMGKTGTAATVVQVFPTVDISGAHVAHDILFVPTQVPNAARIFGGIVMVHGVTVVDLQDLAYPLDLYLAQTNVSLGAANTPAAGVDADILKIKKLCRIEAADFDDLGGAKLATRNGLGCMFKADDATKDMYIFGIIRAGATYTDPASLSIKLEVIQF